MGLDIEQSEFSRGDHERFQRKLFDNLTALKRLLSEPDFGRGNGSIGAELEMYIVDERARPLAANTDIHAAADDPQLTLELNRYNLEYNLTPVGLNDSPFTAIEQEILTKLRTLNATASQFGGRIVPIGILPSLKRRDFGLAAMTNLKRYHALTEMLRQRREDFFSIRIDGVEPVSIRAEDVTFEGANTSLQLHYRVDPQQFTGTFNAVQFVTPLVLAIAANSPFFLGRRLWHETRVPLFKQSIDGRNRSRRALHLPSRVDFGHGWVRHGAYELFAESVHLHRPILPVCSGDDPLHDIDSGKLPALYELRLHQGTIWYWNRPIYDHHGAGHLRIEMRAMPAGPTAVDMLANCAFQIGLAEGLREQIEELIPAMPFQLLVYNFYRAAQFGLQAKLLWPALHKNTLQELPARDIAVSLLNTAKKGLQSIGISSAEANYYLGIIGDRLEHNTNGADWQLRQFERYYAQHSRDKALKMMLQDYIQLADENTPVAYWDSK
ncbi:MAG: hypothetical protein ACR2P1_24240 [Pseudomonadales bacterium]